MSDIEEVLTRLRADHGFRDELERDPRAALAGYQLTADDLRSLADHAAADERHTSARRSSRSALLALLAASEPDQHKSNTDDET
jgi:hypothetical protein